jgi:hypothetical protein
MEKSFFKTLAEDLLNLEINTILKEDMSGAKMPSSRRQALYEIASDYNKKLAELGIRKPVSWEYAGIRSFGELRDRAKTGMATLGKTLESVPRDKKEELGKEIKLVERIYSQSSNMVGLFYRLRAKTENRKHLGGYLDAPEQAEPAKSHETSEKWNNDITRQRMNEIDDLDLNPEQVTQIRKAWEIGTERIVMQTVIQIDGDITTRLWQSFASSPNKTIMEIHNQSISISTEFWSNLVKTLGDIAGKTLNLILGRSQ